jgi:hypothetical protein
MDHDQNWLIFPYIFIVSRSHYPPPAPVASNPAAPPSPRPPCCVLCAVGRRSAAWGSGSPVRRPRSATSTLMMRRARHLLATAPQSCRNIGTLPRPCCPAPPRRRLGWARESIWHEHDSQSRDSQSRRANPCRLRREAVRAAVARGGRGRLGRHRLRGVRRCAVPPRLVIKSRWVSTPLPFAGQMQPRRLSV